MKLIELGCDQASFKTLRFNPEGLTLIVGDGAKNHKDEGSSNGVGKTLALGLVHHCLAGKADDKLKTAVPDWLFSLTFRLNQREHRIERSGDGKRIALNEKTIKIAALREWLNDCGAFQLDPQIPGISFRGLFNRFARLRREDCVDPLRTYRQQDFDAQLCSLYLLGIDCSLALNKRRTKHELESIQQSAKNWQHDPILKEIFRAGAQPKVRAEWLENTIPRLKEDLSRFQIAEDYRAIELEAGELTRHLRELEQESAVLRFQLDGISKALQTQPDITRSDLLDLYGGLQTLFKPEALSHFEAVEQFHHTLAANRKTRLEKDRLTIELELTKLERERHQTATERDQQLQTLQGKRALDEYAVLARQMATLEEEKQRLDDYINLADRLKLTAQQLRECRVEDDRRASQYVATSPLASAHQHFIALAAQLYPQHPAGIVLENNVGDNQLRYDLTVQIEGDDSDGINAARILCFDWLILMHGAHHTMNMLWHDNRLFADIDPKSRAAWFAQTLNSLPGTGKQYVATLNTENFAAMQPHFNEAQWEQLHAAVGNRLLRGDKPENKLLGVQFGSA